MKHHRTGFRARRSLGPVLAMIALLAALAMLALPSLATRAPARSAVEPGLIQIDLRRLALNALLAPLLDDTDPPRWADPSTMAGCGPATSVTVDGQPLVPGAALPTRAFTLHWSMEGCMPFGPDAIVLSGVVELDVTPDDAGLHAVVRPRQLRVWRWAGGQTLDPFSARLALR